MPENQLMEEIQLNSSVFTHASNHMEYIVADYYILSDI